MISTTTTVLPDFLKTIVTETLQTIGNISVQEAHFFWSLLISILSTHWLFLLGILFIIVLVATIRSMFGYWGMLGSVIYNILYFGTLFIIGLIYGPDVFVGDFFKPLCVIILYPVCYWLVGKFLKRIRVI